MTGGEACSPPLGPGDAPGSEARRQTREKKNLGFGIAPV